MGQSHSHSKNHKIGHQDKVVTKTEKVETKQKLGLSVEVESKQSDNSQHDQFGVSENRSRSNSGFNFSSPSMARTPSLLRFGFLAAKAAATPKTAGHSDHNSWSQHHRKELHEATIAHIERSGDSNEFSYTKIVNRVNSELAKENISLSAKGRKALDNSCRPPRDFADKIGVKAVIEEPHLVEAAMQSIVSITMNEHSKECEKKGDIQSATALKTGDFIHTGIIGAGFANRMSSSVGVNEFSGASIYNDMRISEFKEKLKPVSPEKAVSPPRMR